MPGYDFAGPMASGAGTGAMVGGPWGAVAGAGIGALGSLMGGSKAAAGAKAAAKIQAKAMLEQQKRAQEYQEKMTGRGVGYLDPYLSTFGGQNTLDEFNQFGQLGGYGGDLLAQMQQLGEGGLNLDYQADPAYQWRQQQQEEALNRQLAGRGLYDSRAGMNMLTDANMDLSGQEADKQYGRAVNEYNRQYGDLSNRYNLGYTDLMNRFNVGSNAANNVAGMWSGLGTNVGNQMVNTGIASGNNTANLRNQAAQTWGSTLSGLGQNIQQGLQDYRMQPYINNIMKNMAHRYPEA